MEQRGFISSHKSSFVDETLSLIDNGNISGARQQWKDCLLGMLYKDDWDKIIEYAGHCITQLPDFFLGYFARGISYSETGKLEEALQDLTKASVLKPEEPSTFFNKASVEWEMERYEEADEDCRKMLASDIKHDGFYELAARVKTMLGQNKEAVDLYRQAIELRPDYADYYIQLAAVLGSDGDFINAMDTITKAETILNQTGKHNPEARHWMNFYFTRAQIKRQMGDDTGCQEDYSRFEEQMKLFSERKGLS